MNATGQRWKLDCDSRWKAFSEHVSLLRLSGKPPTVQFLKDDRSLDQNSMINALYGQIASQSEDESTLDSRRHRKA